MNVHETTSENAITAFLLGQEMLLCIKLMCKEMKNENENEWERNGMNQREYTMWNKTKEKQKYDNIYKELRIPHYGNGCSLLRYCFLFEFKR